MHAYLHYRWLAHRGAASSARHPSIQAGGEDLSRKLPDSIVSLGGLDRVLRC
jgi:hypothetical protein